MPVCLLTLELYIPDARSLKDKRQVIQSLKERLRGHYNVAVAELEYQDVWQRSVIGVVSISGNQRYLAQAIEKVAQESERMLGRDLVSQDVEFF
jgi:uncharacterized protein YlxP (DUF503 family)